MRARDPISRRLSQSPKSDKATAVPRRVAWPQLPRRQGPASRPGTVEVESRESAPKLTQLQTLE